MHRGNRVKPIARPLRRVPRADILLDLAVAANTKRPSAVDGLVAQFEMVAGQETTDV
jgi:hypothetical protein